MIHYLNVENWLKISLYADSTQVHLESWEFIDGPKMAEQNLDGSSAAAVAIYAYCDAERILLHRAGEQLGQLDNSFVAEAIALEMARVV